MRNLRQLLFVMPKGAANVTAPLLSKYFFAEHLARMCDGAQKVGEQFEGNTLFGGLCKGFEGKVTLVADLGKALAEFLPIDRARIGHEMLVVMSVVVVNVERLDTLAKLGNIGREALAERVEVPCVKAKPKAFLARLGIERVNVFDRLVCVSTNTLGNADRGGNDQIFKANCDVCSFQRVNEPAVKLFVQCLDGFGRVYGIVFGKANTVNDKVFAADSIAKLDRAFVNADRIIQKLGACCHEGWEGSVRLRDHESVFSDSGQFLVRISKYLVKRFLKNAGISK